MKGRIKTYDENRGFGFIVGEDENDYFFHISDVKSMEPICRGMFVEYVPSETDKGKVAKKIVFLQIDNNRHPSFVSLGDARVKLSNIKNYGISEGQVFYAKVYEYHKPEGGFVKKLLESGYVWKGLKQRLPADSEYEAYNYMSPQAGFGVYGRFYKQENGKIYMRDIRISTESDIIIESESYLYLTTYQGDNYKFWEHEASFDIFKKCKELDSVLS